MPEPRPLSTLLPPALFVVIWATGFIVARLVAPHIEPLTFMLVRYIGAGSVLAVFAVITGASWPRTGREVLSAVVSGILLHAAYLGGVFWAVRHGMPGGITSLIVGLQPIATAALVGPLLGEAVSLRRWSGVIIGLAGALLVILPKLGWQGGIPLPALMACLIAMLAITFGTIWQKRTGAGINLLTGTVVQYAAAFVITLPVAYATETMHITLSRDLVIGWLWAIFGLSIGAILLLLSLIRKGAVASVASLIYLVPPLAALMAWLAFGETLSGMQIIGMMIAAAGVAIANRG